MITRWMIKAPAVQVPEVSTWVHRLERSPMVTMRRMITSDPDSRFWANWRSSS